MQNNGGLTSFFSGGCHLWPQTWSILRFLLFLVIQNIHTVLFISQTSLGQMSCTTINAVDIALAYLEGLGPMQALRVCDALKAHAEHQLRYKSRGLTDETIQCQAITKAGTRCRFAGVRSGYCGRHFKTDQMAKTTQYASLNSEDWQRIVASASQEVRPVDFTTFHKTALAEPSWRKPSARRVLFPAPVTTSTTPDADCLDALNELLDHKHNVGANSGANKKTVVKQQTTVIREQVELALPQTQVQTRTTCGANGGVTKTGQPCRRNVKPGQRCFNHPL